MNRHQSISRVADPVPPVCPVIGPIRVGDSLAVPLRYRRGEVIYSAERSIERWYRVLAGAARRFTLRSSGRRQIVDLLLPGDVFGFGIGGKHYFSAEAVSADTAIAQYPCSRIRMSATSGSMIAKELCEMVRQETSRLQTLILILGGITAEEKAGAFLVNLADRLAGGASWPVSLPISRYDIADFLAISVETVSRALASLKAVREILPLQCLANPSSISPVLEGFDQVATRPGRQRLRPRGLIGESCNSDNRDVILRAVADDGVGPNKLGEGCGLGRGIVGDLAELLEGDVVWGQSLVLGGTEAMPRE
jgi:CRP/FNR family nitrogen fixation transcriptional regulator